MYLGGEIMGSLCFMLIEETKHKIHFNLVQNIKQKLLFAFCSSLQPNIRLITERKTTLPYQECLGNAISMQKVINKHKLATGSKEILKILT